MRRRHVLFLLAGVGTLVAVVLIALLRSKPEVLYETTLLPTLGRIPVAPHAINDHGRIVGAAEVTPGQWHMILWDKDKGLQDLGAWARHQGSQRLGINNAGQIAGTVVDANGVGRAFIQDPNGTRRLLVDPAGRESVATALNNRGQVVGYYETAGKPRRACVWDRTGRMTDLGALGGTESLACSINDRGQVAGVAGVRGPIWQAFLWDPNTGMIGLGPDPLHMATSCYVNNKGLVAGGVWLGEGPVGDFRLDQERRAATAEHAGERLPGGSRVERRGSDPPQRLSSRNSHIRPWLFQQTRLLSM